MMSLPHLLALWVTIQLCIFASSSLVLGLKKFCSLCPSGELKSHRSGDEMTSMLALDEPCGVYTLPCALGLRCIPPTGEQSPLQALLQGRGACRNSKNTISDIPPPTDYEPSTTENNEKGPCRKLLNSVLQSIELTVIHSVQDIYIPNCDKQGSFRRKQCRSSRGMQRGHCWCVDEKGSKISSRRRSDGSISCSSA
ncbi:insulin-like growth factor-binding protein 6a precursor [Danio rerio]|uniref:Insulin-like growth factor-binding protein 6a precursor n=2 Tax=Danio rerio TaxID=7955 RepID=A0AB40E5I1_DANRE